MAIKELAKDKMGSEQMPQNPWVETPLRESYALSQAAGWYSAYPLNPLVMAM